MARHARARVPFWGLRSAYRALRVQYAGLLKAYEELSAEHELLLRPPQDDLARQTGWGRDNEELLQTAEIPVITDLPHPRRVPSWADTSPLPVESLSGYLRGSGLLISVGGTERAEQGIAD